jgi:hypothetical protein
MVYPLHSTLIRFNSIFALPWLTINALQFFQRGQVKGLLPWIWSHISFPVVLFYGRIFKYPNKYGYRENSYLSENHFENSQWTNCFWKKTPPLSPFWWEIRQFLSHILVSSFPIAKTSHPHAKFHTTKTNSPKQIGFCAVFSSFFPLPHLATDCICSSHLLDFLTIPLAQ